MQTNTKLHSLNRSQQFRLRLQQRWALWGSWSSAALLALAPVLPTPARAVVLPAILAGPGCAVLGFGGISTSDANSAIYAALVVPISIALVILDGLALYMIAIRLDTAAFGWSLSFFCCTPGLLAFAKSRAAGPRRSGTFW